MLLHANNLLPNNTSNNAEADLRKIENEVILGKVRQYPHTHHPRPKPSDVV